MHPHVSPPFKQAHLKFIHKWIIKDILKRNKSITWKEPGFKALCQMGRGKRGLRQPRIHIFNSRQHQPRRKKDHFLHGYQEQRFRLINWQEGHWTEGLSCRERQKTGQWETCVSICGWTVSSAQAEISATHRAGGLNGREGGEGGESTPPFTG